MDTRLKLVEKLYNVTPKWFVVCLVLILVVVSCVQGQQIKIYSRYGNIERTVQTYSDQMIYFTDGSNLKYMRMDSVKFLDRQISGLEDMLKVNNVKVIEITEKDKALMTRVLNSYYNFYKEEDAKVIWQYVFQDNAMGTKQIDALIRDNRCLKLVRVDSSEAILDIVDFVYEKSGYNLSARALVQWKEDAYRVTVKDIHYKPGAGANATATVFLGGNPNFEFQANSAFVKKNGEWSKTNGNPKLMNDAFLVLFKVKEKSSDW